MPKTLQLTIPDEAVILEIIATFSPEENYLMLKIGSEWLKEGRNAVVGLTQKEIYEKIKDETKEEVKRLELDIIVQREMGKQMEEKISKMYEGQVEKLEKQVDNLLKQLKTYEIGNNELIQNEVEKAVESKQIDKPMDLYYNKGQLVFVNVLTNEEELRNFQSKNYTLHRISWHKY